MFANDTTYNQYSGTFGGAKIYFCHTSRTSLSTTFSDNYSGKTPVLVLSKSSLALNWTENKWNEIAFDTPFAYNGTDNLLIEIRWSSANGGLITGATSESGSQRALLGSSVSASTGSIQSYRNVFQLRYADPGLAVTPASRAFGSLLVGTTLNLTFSVQNTGGGTLSGSATVPAPFSIVSGGAYNLAAGASQTVTVRYSPTASGTHSQNVTFTGGSGTTRPVTGSAYTAPVLAVTPASRDFGTILVGTTSNLTFSVQNTGGGTLSGSATVPAPFSIVSGGAYNLAAGASQAVTVRYSPIATGAHSQNVTFTGGSGATRPVTGSAYPAPVLAVSPAGLDFHSVLVRTASNLTFTVQNTGGGTLAGSASVPAPFWIVAGGSYSLAAGASQTVTVRYSPTAIATHSQDVTFTGGGDATRPVTGSARTAQAMAVTPAGLDFGSLEVGTLADLAFSVQNTGGGTLAGSASVGAPFSIVSGGSYSLGAGEQQSVTVRYTPAEAAAHSQSVVFTGVGQGETRPVTGCAYSDTLDADGDGMSDWSEIVAGTSPTNDESCLTVSFPSTGATLSSGQGAVIQWFSEANRRYSLDRATSLRLGFNHVVASNLPPTPPLNVHTDRTAVGNGPYFYRVRAVTH